jgi:DNA-binding XRE family transcriptional regulator
MTPVADEPAFKPTEITEAYVKGLADPLTRYMSEPPHDPLTVLAIATQAALFEAWEHIERGETHLRMFDGPPGNRGMESGIWIAHGEIAAGKRVIRRVAEALKLMRPGPECAPGVRVLAARTAKYHTHQTLADAIGVDRAHVSRIEGGARTLTPALAERMAAVLDVTATYLLTGRDEEIIR